jgi:phosphoglycolate phosphatase
MLPMAAPTIVFDLDGTLAETAPDLMGTLNHILLREGLAALPLEKARELVGAGARALLERGFAVAGQPLLPERLETLFRDFLEIYAGRIVAESLLFEGVREALDRLSARGMLLAVCTNKPERHTRLMLEGFGVLDRFAAVAGRDTFPHSKPDPRHLTMTIEAAGGDVARAVMVGDSKTDIVTARAAGVPVVCVPFGYTDAPIESFAPDLVIQDFHALDAAIERLLRR